MRTRYKGFHGVWLALSVASCTAELPITATEAELAHAEQLHAESLVMFSHDHVRGSSHFQNAIAGGVTAMTMELLVDNVRWVKNGVEVVGDFNVGAQQQEINPSWPYETMQQASTRFDNARTDLMSVIDGSGGQVRLVQTVQDIDAAKANGQLGIIIGTEGALMLAGNGLNPVSPSATTATDALARVELLYSQGWRKVQLSRVYQTPFVGTNPDRITDLGLANTIDGRKLVAMLNKRGVIIDAMHLNPGHIDGLAALTNAPLQVSHDWSVCNYSRPQQQLDELVAAGGGHGVISVNALGSFYDCTSAPPRNVIGLVDTLVAMIAKVGIDHVGIGPDYMPEGNTYTLPDIKDAPSLTAELVHRGFSDQDIQKILGGNLRDLYQRIWDPTHGYDGGAAHFRLCSNTDPDPVCVAARSNSGQGDLRHRAINCGHPSGLTPVGMQLAYRSGQWMFKNLSGAFVPCSTDPQGLALVVSWGDGESQNGRIAIHGTAACDAMCQQAINWAGAGTANARALNCQTATSNGVVGLQLVYTAGAWHHYNIAGQLVPCVASSTLVADWGPTAPAPNASVRLCDDYNSHPACAAAATFAGNGTSQAKALNCLSSTPNQADHGTVALQVFYSDIRDANGHAVPGGGHWQYWDASAKAHPCVHGSVLVATTL